MIGAYALGPHRIFYRKREEATAKANLLLAERFAKGDAAEREALLSTESSRLCREVEEEEKKAEESKRAMLKARLPLLHPFAAQSGGWSRLWP